MNNTQAQLIVGDSTSMSEIEDSSVQLVVTSPPYPMIAMWDDIFGNQDPRIKDSLDNNDCATCFELMHQIVDQVWREVERILIPGGIACINIGDATRTVDKNFQLFNNHSRIVQCFLKYGMQTLPTLIWRKQTNAPNKFMGSGMLSPGAYVTLEHEYILIFRKGRKREFKTQPEKLNRSRSAFFWEERNIWFSDVWFDLKGANQKIKTKNLRDRSGAFPFDLAYRLIQMFSVKNDTVVDPFLGAGTTSIASMASQRNSVGYEIDSNFTSTIVQAMLKSVESSNIYIEDRLKRHMEFVDERQKLKGPMGYENEVHGFPVMTRQETKSEFCFITDIESVSKNTIVGSYHVASDHTGGKKIRGNRGDSSASP